MKFEEVRVYNFCPGCMENAYLKELSKFGPSTSSPDYVFTQEPCRSHGGIEEVHSGPGSPLDPRHLSEASKEIVRVYCEKYS